MSETTTEVKAPELPYPELGKPAGRQVYRDIEEIKAGVQLFKIPLDRIKVREGFNRRKENNPGFSHESLSELADQIQQEGQLEPVKGDLVDGVFYLTEGERRYRAFKLLSERPDTVNPIMVDVYPNPVNLSEPDRIFQQLTVNNKVPLSPLEIAEAIAILKETFDISNEEIGKRMSKSRQWVDGMVKLAKKPDEIKEQVRIGSISATQAIQKPMKKSSQKDEMSGIIGKSITPTTSDRTIGGGSGNDMMSDIVPEKEDSEQEKILKNMVKNLGKIESLLKGLQNDQAKADGDNYLKWLRNDADALNLFFSKRENRDASRFITVESVNTLVKLVDAGRVSDGYHTFNELYDHRVQLAINLFSEYSEQGMDVWRTWVHSNGESYEGWFLLGVGYDAGKQITYHLPANRWDDCSFAGIKTNAPDYDGHTSADVLIRLRELSSVQGK